MLPPREPDRTERSPDRRFWVAVLVVSAALVVVWTFIPWQWSPVDDPGQFLTMRELIQANGPLAGVIQRIGALATGDWAGGIFRPLAWIYPPLLYWMPPTPAHVVRLLMLILIVVGPLAYFRRNSATGVRLWITLTILVASVATLSQGLLLLSIQEVGGAMFISLGVLAQRRSLRLTSWILAAWFKGPFSWILIGYAVALWRQGQRRLALASGAFGLGTLVVNVWWSRHGTYAGRYRIDPFDPELWKSAANILEPQNAAVALILIWWLVATQGSLRQRPDFVIFLVAAVGYYAQMIPWGFTAYYMGPITFLIGLLLASMITDPPKLSKWKMLAALAGPVLVATWLLLDALRFVLGTNAIIADATGCLEQIPESNSVLFGNVLYLTSSPEGPIRLQQNIQIAYPGWTGTIATESNSAERFLDSSTTHAIVMGPASLPPGRESSQICAQGSVQVLRLATPQ